VARLELTIIVAAPPERVWAVLEDLEGQGRWMVDVRQLKVTSELKRGVGTVMRVTSTLFGLPIVRDVMEVTAWEPARRMEVRHRGQFHGAGAFTLEARGAGTEFTWTEEIQPPFGVVGAAAFALAVRPHLRRVFMRSMENVRRLAEVATPAA
jgi:uncharacterized protein YndB with AHSA1/START domain